MSTDYNDVTALINGSITMEEYEKRRYERRIAALRATLPVSADQRLLDAAERAESVRADFESQVPSQAGSLEAVAFKTEIARQGGQGTEDSTIQTTDEMGVDESNAFEDALSGATTSTPTESTESGDRDEFGFTADDYKNGIAIYRGDAPSGGERVFSKSDLQKALSDGYSLSSVPLFEGNTGAGGGSFLGSTSGEQIGRMSSQIWQDETGQKFLVFGIPGTDMFVRYQASDEQLGTFYTTGMPGVRSVDSDSNEWYNSLFLGDYTEIDANIKLGLANPFDSLVANFQRIKNVQPWMEDEELYTLWLEGIIEDRDIEDYEWQGTNWWRTHTKEQRDWLLVSQGRGIGELPADAQALLDNNIIRAKTLLQQNGVTNADSIFNPDGESLIEFFALQLSNGNWTELHTVNQAKAIGDPMAGITVDNQLKGWLEGVVGGVAPETTQAGFAKAQELALKWLGPTFAEFESANISEFASMIRNAESPQIGEAQVQERLKAIRKALFSTDLYDENLTYEDIASPWRNYSFQFLGERIDEKKPEFINILRSNDQEEINKILLEYGLNNNIETVFDRVEDNIIEGIAPSSVVRGVPT